MKTVGILGASGLVGESLLDKEYKEDRITVKLFQHKTPLEKFKGKYKIYTDIEYLMNNVDTIISLIPIWELEDTVRMCILNNRKLKKIVALSSTSALTKLYSENRWEREYANKFVEAEKKMVDMCDERNITIVIVRPTMIWGCGRDLNISFIQRFITKYGFFIMPSEGKGLRWPIHHKDLLDIMFKMEERGESGIYTARGKETLSYSDMVERIFSWYKLKPIVIRIPESIIGICAYTARVLSRKPYINKASFMRVDRTEELIRTDNNCIIAKSRFEPNRSNDLLKLSKKAKIINKIIGVLSRKKK